MKTPSRSGLFVALILAAVIGVGYWTVRGERSPAGAATSGSASDILALIPSLKGDTASEREITNRIARVRLKMGESKEWTGLGDALMQKARETEHHDFLEAAEQVYRQAVKLNPKNADAMTGLAWAHGAHHEFPQSLEWAGKAIALQPDNHQAHGIIGDAKLEMGDYDAAYEHYQKMLDIRPDISSYSRGANLLYVTGDVRKGIWLMEKAARAGGPYAENTAWCRAQLALMLFNTGARLPAEQLVERSLKQTPGSLHLLMAAGKIRTAKKEYASAIAAFEKANTISPRQDTSASLGDLYTLKGDKVRAEREFQRVEEIHRAHVRDGVQGGTQIALFWADHDRNLPAAVQLAEENYKTFKNVHAADALAWCYYKSNRLKEASVASKKALSRGTPDAGIHFHAGMIHARLGDRPSARKHLYAALNLNPDFSPVDAPIAARTLEQLGSIPEGGGVGPGVAKVLSAPRATQEPGARGLSK